MFIPLNQKKGYNIMARHRDISKTHARLEGEGWHLEYHHETVTNPNKKRTRRSKNKCIYYNSGMCNHAHASCMGVSCGAYSEVAVSK